MRLRYAILPSPGSRAADSESALHERELRLAGDTMTMTSGPDKIDIEGTGEYPEAGDIVTAFKAGKLSFNHALRRMEEDFEITQEDALYVLWPPMEEEE